MCACFIFLSFFLGWDAALHSLILHVSVIYFFNSFFIITNTMIWEKIQDFNNIFRQLDSQSISIIFNTGKVPMHNSWYLSYIIIITIFFIYVYIFHILNPHSTLSSHRYSGIFSPFMSPNTILHYLLNYWIINILLLPFYCECLP